MASFGETSASEREMRGVSLREIADGTKISVRFLQALEEDRIDVLPGGLFPRAFVKQYALYLGLDPERDVADFVAAHGEAPPERRAPGVATVAALRRGSPPRRPGRARRRARAAARGGERRHAPRRQPTPTPVAAAPAVLPTDRVYPSPRSRRAARRGEGLVLT